MRDPFVAAALLGLSLCAVALVVLWLAQAYCYCKRFDAGPRWFVSTGDRVARLLGVPSERS
jgi:hypothetical protein